MLNFPEIKVLPCEGETTVRKIEFELWASNLLQKLIHLMQFLLFISTFFFRLFIYSSKYLTFSFIRNPPFFLTLRQLHPPYSKFCHPTSTHSHHLLLHLIENQRIQNFPSFLLSWRTLLPHHRIVNNKNQLSCLYLFFSVPSIWLFLGWTAPKVLFFHFIFSISFLQL